MTWRGAVGLVVALGAAVGTGIVWQDDGTDRLGPGSGGVDAGAVSGLDLFQAKGCAGCHDGPGIERAFTPAPDLSDAAEWAGERRPGLRAEEYIAESIRQPAAFTSPAWSAGSAGPLSGMPSLTLSEQEIEALTDYLLQQ